MDFALRSRQPSYTKRPGTPSYIKRPGTLSAGTIPKTWHNGPSYPRRSSRMYPPSSPGTCVDCLDNYPHGNNRSLIEDEDNPAASPRTRKETKRGGHTPANHEPSEVRLSSNYTAPLRTGISRKTGRLGKVPAPPARPSSSPAASLRSRICRKMDRLGWAPPDQLDSFPDLQLLYGPGHGEKTRIR